MPEIAKKPSKKKVDPNSWRGKIKSQELWGKFLVPNFWCLLIIYVILGVVLLLLGIMMLMLANNINSIEVRYDNLCTVGDSAGDVIFTADKAIKSPKLYYKLDNFYGNHRNFIKSRSFIQLRGTTGQSISDGSPIKKNDDVDSPLLNLASITLTGSDDANPCGLTAKYIFTDEFTLYYNTNSTQITIDETGIAHSVDKNSRFQRPNNYLNIQWHDTEDEHLMVWFQTDAFPSFIKLWGFIDEDIQKGESYKLTVDTKWGESSFDVKKYIYISETNVFGGDNITFGVLYLAAGGVFLTLSVIMIILEFIKRRRDKNQVHNNGQNF